MARDYSKISPRVWKSKKFWALPDAQSRLAYLYLLSGPHTTSAGCFEIPVVYISADLKVSDDEARKAIDSLSSVGLIAFDHDDETVWIEQWFKYNPPTNAKHAQGIFTHIKEAPSAEMKFKAAQSLSNICKEKGFSLTEVFYQQIDAVMKGYRKGIATETETKTETETETQTETRDPDQDRYESSTEPREVKKERGSSPSSPGAAPPDGAHPSPSASEAKGDRRNVHSLLDTPAMRRADAKLGRIT